MAEQVDHAAIQREVERVLPALQESSTEELFSVIGSLPLEPDHEDDLAALGLDDLYKTRISVRGVGERFALYSSKVQGVVCRNKDAFGSLIDASNVTALVALLLPTLGFAATAVPPAAVIALAVVILRVGLNEYCKNFSEEPATAPAG
jgi:hypothetical protein